MADIQIVQGDDKHILVDFVSANPNVNGNSIIESFYFSSKALGISKHFTEKDSDGKWYVTLTSEETMVFPAGAYTFDITAKTVDSTTLTGVYHGTVCIKEKDNSIAL